MLTRWKREALEGLPNIFATAQKDRRKSHETHNLLGAHRTQNNSILRRLGKIPTHHSLPLVDTVERIQGAERDVIRFGLTPPDPDHLAGEFLNSPNRLNVVMTRAPKKIDHCGQPGFFSTHPRFGNCWLDTAASSSCVRIAGTRMRFFISRTDIPLSETFDL